MIGIIFFRSSFAFFSSLCPSFVAMIVVLAKLRGGPVDPIRKQIQIDGRGKLYTIHKTMYNLKKCNYHGIPLACKNKSQKIG